MVRIGIGKGAMLTYLKTKTQSLRGELSTKLLRQDDILGSRSMNLYSEVTVEDWHFCCLLVVPFKYRRT